MRMDCCAETARRGLLLNSDFITIGSIAWVNCSVNSGVSLNSGGVLSFSSFSNRITAQSGPHHHPISDNVASKRVGTVDGAVQERFAQREQQLCQPSTPVAAVGRMEVTTNIIANIANHS